MVDPVLNPRSELRKLGFAFNSEGKLRKIDPNTGEPGDEPYEHDENLYEDIAKIVTYIVYEELEKHGLARSYIPDNIPKEDATFVFTYPPNLQRSKKLLILIHGSGQVRAGQWSRSLIINQSMDHGTMIPYIKKAKELGYDILITNTNDNQRAAVNGVKTIPRSATPVAHAVSVWLKYIQGTDPEHVAIVAHSYGGAVTLALASQFTSFFKNRVFAIALTDSTHLIGGSTVMKLIRSLARNFVVSNKPLGEELKMDAYDIPKYSAGSEQHEMTSYSAISEVFEFFEQRYALCTKAKKPRLEKTNSKN